MLEWFGWHVAGLGRELTPNRRETMKFSGLVFGCDPLTVIIHNLIDDLVRKIFQHLRPQEGLSRRGAIATALGDEGSQLA